MGHVQTQTDVTPDPSRCMDHLCGVMEGDSTWLRRQELNLQSLAYEAEPGPSLPAAPRTGIEPVSTRRQRVCDTSRITRHGAGCGIRTRLIPDYETGAIPGWLNRRNRADFVRSAGGAGRVRAPSRESSDGCGAPARIRTELTRVQTGDITAMLQGRIQESITQAAGRRALMSARRASQNG